MIQFATNIEHTLVFARPNGEVVNLAVQHYGTTHEVTLMVFSDEHTDTIKEQITLSYHETRLLRDLLNRPEVQVILDREEEN